ncbi:fimbrial biogenesis chaperone [Janthinobacterium agaricidamnosum]|uniref:Pili assembly chaperone protein n=1 Tax=Janthinobacterium agaricidamnosum NBRC 102515 = DSM 9628 TaxID=1349767 RepID=W0VDF6_9BURK|nr:fimbria/pilus periplasmic chaperone [Janthinobacterium agaricidamnosum]CDG85418.1 pili assembly chaperone protein [Janthinobacterium agaricidamnosum NBRC 102515 = DSM 9628]
MKERLPFFHLPRLPLLAVLACLWPVPGGAANLQISPVMINFLAEQNSAGINLQNLGVEPMVGQVRVFLWEQQNGDDVLTPTQEVVASPPIVEVAPSSRQTIRLVRTQKAGGGERTYRVLIDELAREDGSGKSGVDIRLRYSVPVFVAAPGGPGKENLSWTFFRKDGDWMLRLQNSGNYHAQIGAFSVANQAGKKYVLSEGLFGYVLAGRMREWRLPVARDADLNGALTLTVNVNAKALIAKNTTQE